MNKFKAGDDLRCIDASDTACLVQGKEYTCLVVTSTGKVVLRSVSGCGLSVYDASRFVLANTEDIADRLQGLVIQAELARDSYRQERRAYLDVASMLLELQGEVVSVCRELDLLVNGALVAESGVV